jgi:polysaccharide biosynthesis protein PslH
VAWQNLIAVADEYDTTLLSFAPPDDRVEVPRELVGRGVRVVTVAFRPPPAWIAALRGVVGRWPYTLTRYRSNAFERAIRGEIARRRPAFAYVHHLHLATYVDALHGVPMVLREHNLDSRSLERYARARSGTPTGVYTALQARRVNRAEAVLCRRAALVLAIQNDEAAALRRIAPDVPVEILPVGVDLTRVPRRAPASPPVALLAGSFQWRPNVDGALRFLEDGWPRLRERAPGVLLRVAGKGPPPELQRACSTAGVALASDVPSMAEEYARATLLLVPLWIGAGVRVKIVEALAARLPVVATPLGAAGLGLEAGEHFVEADTPKAMADGAAALFSDPRLQEALALAGRAYAERHWSLEHVVALQSRLLASVVTAHEPPGQGSPVVCTLCGSRDVRILAILRSEVDSKEYRAVRCTRCELLFAHPLPDPSLDSIQELYGGEYTQEQRQPDRDPTALEVLRAATNRQMEIVERYVERGTALNVGAMSGATKILEERGWKLRHVDVSRHAAETARALWGFDVAVSRIEDFPAESGTFDFVKLGHVIEHLVDPRGAMENVARILKPGGVVLVDTDNAGGLRTWIEITIRRVLGEKAAAAFVRRFTGKDLGARYGRLIPPVHLHLFSESNLRRLLETAGFEVLEVRKPAWGDPTWFPLVGLRRLSLAERAFIKLDQIGAVFGRGDLLSVLARRVTGTMKV